jgi:hypothetical protein
LHERQRYAKSDAMPTEPTVPPPGDATSDTGNELRPLTPAAQRALDEAAARRAERERQAQTPVKEVGRSGLDPTRYGDWEKDGLASDF